MIHYLFQLSDPILFILISFVFIIISLISIVLIKLFVPLSLRYTDNAVIGYTVNLVSVIYGVLVGISALYLINNNNYTSDAVQREANAVANIYRETSWLPLSVQNDIHTELKNYLIQVINIEWKEMEKGEKVNTAGDIIINKIDNQLNLYNKSINNQSIIMYSLVDEVKSLYNARQQRIQKSYESLSPDLWVVILIGTALILCINYFFGMNFYLHIGTVVAAALMSASMVFLLVSTDKPFQGEFIIQPDPFKAVLALIDNKEFQPSKQ